MLLSVIVKALGDLKSWIQAVMQSVSRCKRIGPGL